MNKSRERKEGEGWIDRTRSSRPAANREKPPVEKDRVGWAAVGFDFDRNTEIKHWSLIPEEQNQQIYKPKEKIHKSKEQKQQ